jgi:hypothetical protein
MFQEYRKGEELSRDIAQGSVGHQAGIGSLIAQPRQAISREAGG